MIGRWLFRAWCAAVLAFLLVPIAAIVPLSFSAGSFLSYPLPGWSLRWYAEVLGGGKWLAALGNSLFIGVLATVVVLHQTRERIRGHISRSGVTVERLIAGEADQLRDAFRRSLDGLTLASLDGIGPLLGICVAVEDIYKRAVIRRCFDEGEGAPAPVRAVLAALEPAMATAGPEAQVRYQLELGRTDASATHVAAQITPEAAARARAVFGQALRLARASGLDALAIDAIHMFAFVDTSPVDQLHWGTEALDIATRSQQADAQQERRRQQAARDAAEMIRQAVPGPHDYLARKHLSNVQGLVMPDGALLVPMRNWRDNNIQGAQVIRWLPDERVFDKKMLPGMRAKGAVLRLGQGRETILCEGYATGLSIELAVRSVGLPASVLVTFSATNLVHVAQFLKGRVFVFADNDKSEAGERAAQDTGHPYCMSDVVGEDANDVHARAGLMAVAQMLMRVRRSEAVASG